MTPNLKLNKSLPFVMWVTFEQLNHTWALLTEFWAKWILHLSMMHFKNIISPQKRFDVPLLFKETRGLIIPVSVLFKLIYQTGLSNQFKLFTWVKNHSYRLFLTSYIEYLTWIYFIYIKHAYLHIRSSIHLIFFWPVIRFRKPQAKMNCFMLSASSFTYCFCMF